MSSEDTLCTALQAALPPECHGAARTLAALLARALEGELNAAALRARIGASAELAEAIAVLASGPAQGGRAAVSFAGAQAGEIRIDTVAGGNLVQIGQLTIALGGAAAEAAGPPRPAEPRADAPLPPRPAVREAMTRVFSLEELDALCADLEADLAAAGINVAVNMELVGGSGKGARVLNLIEYLERRGLLPHLIARLRIARPGSGPWDA